MKFSIVVVTNRGVDTLRALFLVSHPDAEVIIIDSHYSEERKQELKLIPHGFKQVVYAPPKKADPVRRFDMMSALNTGYAYAEGEWTMRMDDNAEFKPDFFERLEEDIVFFSKEHGNRFIVRQLELEGGCGDVKWTSFIKDVPDRYYRVPPGVSRGGVPVITAGIFFCHRDVMFDLNGFDERYDDGLGWNDNDMLFRAVAAGYKVFYDVQLMIYRAPHVSSGVDVRDVNKQLFISIFKDKLMAGVYRSENPFTLQQLHEELLPQKKEYVI